MEQWRLATLSFKLWGALSPTKELPTAPELSSSISSDPKKNDDAEIEKREIEPHGLPTISAKRSIGQAEIESAFYKVFLTSQTTGFLIKNFFLLFS